MDVTCFIFAQHKQLQCLLRDSSLRHLSFNSEHLRDVCFRDYGSLDVYLAKQLESKAMIQAKVAPPVSSVCSAGHSHQVLQVCGAKFPCNWWNVFGWDCSVKAKQILNNLSHSDWYQTLYVASVNKDLLQGEWLSPWGCSASSPMDASMENGLRLAWHIWCCA